MPLNSPIITGDVSGGLHSTSVDKLKGNAVSATAPTTGQTLVWTGSAWAPATPSSGGGGGANGLTYYLRQDVDADAPTTNLPGTPKQLGRTGATAQTTVTSSILSTGVWTLLGGYVSEAIPIDPNITAIPGGLWDLNLWALGTANQQSPTVIRAKVYTYNGADAPTLLATSGEQIINTVSAQYSVSVLVPQTTVELTTRIYIAIEVQASANNHTATLQFGDGTPSHVHTSLPLVGGTGLWRSISGVLQPNGTQISDSDVASDAAIAQSKISGLTTALAGKAGQSVVQVFGTAGTFSWSKPAGLRHIVVELVSGGNGGGAGGKGTSGTAIYGGTGGGAGGYSRTLIDATDLTDSTYQVTVGAGGNGAVFGVSTAQIGGISGFAPDSAPTQFLARAVSGTLPGQNGGTTAPSAGSGGAPNSNAGGGTSITGTAAAGSASANAPTGGGGGGGISAAPAPYNGGNGGTNPFINVFSAGGGQSSVANGGSPTAAPTRTPASLVMNGAGGGGGGASTFASGSGGNGANGTGNGTGGGGGGATIGSGNGGNGGNGAKGIVVVTSYF